MDPRIVSKANKQTKGGPKMLLRYSAEALRIAIGAHDITSRLYDAFKRFLSLLWGYAGSFSPIRFRNGMELRHFCLPDLGERDPHI